MIICPAPYYENLNLVCNNPLAPSRKGIYIPKFIVHMIFRIQNEYFNSFKSLHLIVYLWSSIYSFEIIYETKEFDIFYYYYSALLNVFIKLTAIIAATEQITQNTAPIKNGAPRFSLNN